jgi:hypothetical protein
VNSFRIPPLLYLLYAKSASQIAGGPRKGSG